MQNTEGYTAFTEEFVSNIDKKSPGPVFDFGYVYRRMDKNIILYWKLPEDSDLAYIKLSYTKNETTVVVDIPYDEFHDCFGYTIFGVEPDDSEYKEEFNKNYLPFFTEYFSQSQMEKKITSF